MIGSTHTAFVDANVFYSRTLRDWLGLIYGHGDVQVLVVHWTEDVMAEVLRNLRRRHPEWDGGKITRLRDQLTSIFEVGRVDDFVVDGTYAGSDPHDAHVHAAATACKADFLVTCNTKDFPQGDTTYEVLSPDELFVLIDDSAPLIVRDVIVQQCVYWLRRSEGVNLVAQLRGAGCPNFAERVRRHLQQIDFDSAD